MSVYSEQAEIEHQHLLRFALRVIDGPNPAAAVAADRGLIDQITPAQVITLVDDLVHQEIPMERIKTGVNKLINLFYRNLAALPPVLLDHNPLLKALSRNNRLAETALSALRPMLIERSRTPHDQDLLEKIRRQLQILDRFTGHYTLKENVVFPLLEKLWPAYRCLSVMWSIHDDVRSNLKEGLTLLSRESFDQKRFSTLTGRIFFDVSTLIFREEKILYPHMMATLDETDWRNMLEQSFDIDWPFEAPQRETLHITSDRNDEPLKSLEEGVDLGSGRPSPEQLARMLNHLPLDLTLVDENDRVVYFSEGKERIFPRSRAIIGRMVQNCHPPESVHIVEEIIGAFRRGEQERADFWIDLPRGKILIRYFALRDAKGDYRGILEVSQEISSIQAVAGERRLLDWGD